MTRSNATLFIFSLAVAGFAGCSKEEAAKPPERAAVAVKVAPVQMKTMDRTVDIVGTLYGDEEVVISAKVPGRILSISADVGDRVTGGQQLAAIDPVDYQLEVSRRQSALSEALSKIGLSEVPPSDYDVAKVSTVERARFQATNAQAKLERARKVFQQQPPLISEQEFADIQTAYDVAQRDFEVARLEAQSLLAAALSRRSELAAAQQQLADTKLAAPPLAAPRTYAVSQRLASAGEYVTAGTPLFRLVLDDQLKFRGALVERHVGHVKKGQRVSLRIEGVPEPAIGEISRINPAIDTATRTFQIEALFPNPNGTLRPGAFGRGTIKVGVDENVIMIPRRAVRSFAGIDKVFTVKDSKAVEHVVDLGIERDGMLPLRPTERLGGANELIIEGIDRLAAGVPVTASPATQPATLAKDDQPKR